MFEIIKSDTKIDFVGQRHIWAVFSIVLTLIFAVLFFTKGLNYGIDFTGGAEVQLKAPEGWDIGKLRDTLGAGGMNDLRVQQIGADQDRQFLIKTQVDEKELNGVSARIEKIFNDASVTGYSIERVDVVGPAAGASLRMSGFLSMLYALLCIMIYVAIRFDTRYAPGVLFSLFHDATMTIGFFIITQKQFDLQILAAILALIGYSNNDTIIVFDRVRETLHNNPGLNIRAAVNRAVNETLSRTILTAFTTFLTVLALYIFGGEVIENFALTLMVGIFIGTYSSIFIASALVVYVTEWQEARPQKTKQTRKPSSSGKKVAPPSV